VKDNLSFCFSGLAWCKRDALPAKLTALNQNYHLVKTIIYESQNRFYTRKIYKSVIIEC